MSVLAQDVLTLDPMPDPGPAAVSLTRASLAVDSLLAAGRLRLRVHGESMLPTLWPGDLVDVTRCSLARLRPGEIALAFRDGRFFLHRFLRVSPSGGFFLRGDSMPGPDPEFPAGAFLGRIADRPASSTVSVFHWRRLIGLLLCHCAPVRCLALAIHSRRYGPALPSNSHAPAAALDIGVS